MVKVFYTNNLKLMMYGSNQEWRYVIIYQYGMYAILYWRKMSFINSNKIAKSPELQADIVKSILLSCIDGVSINGLFCAFQRTLPSPYDGLKKYLFHLIDYDLISYNGQTQMYTTEEGGHDLLDWINRERMIMNVDIKDIVITIE
jgi:hypothetical protein